MTELGNRFVPRDTEMSDEEHLCVRTSWFLRLSGLRKWAMTAECECLVGQGQGLCEHKGGRSEEDQEALPWGRVSGGGGVF